VTHRELDLLASLTSKTFDERDEYQLLNDGDYWTLVESALAWNVHKSVDQFRADVDHIEYVRRPDGPVIHTQGYLLRGYLMEKALHELREASK